MDTTVLGVALTAGLVAAFNPCGFAMLPAYLTLVVVGDGEERNRVTALGRALAATTAMALGFLMVFGTFGLVISPLMSQVFGYLPVVTVVIGVLLLALGGWLLAGRELSLLLPKPRGGVPTAQLGSMFGYGIAYALASLSCTIGPFLGVIGATFRSDRPFSGVLAFVAYAGGMTLVVGVLAIGVALAGTAVVTRMRAVLPYINRIAGGLLVVAGLYVTYYGIYDYRTVYGDGPVRDPVIDAAQWVRDLLAGLVTDIGVVPLLVALGVLVASVLLLQRRRVARREDQRMEPPRSTLDS